MNKLPEEYVVKCNKDNLEANEVLSAYYKYETTGHKWNYIICTSKLNVDGVPQGNAVEDRIRPEYAKMPLFTYEQWKELFYQKQFVLPEKWYVVSTDETDPALIKWRDGGYTSRPACLLSRKYWENIPTAIAQGYIEITFEQFKEFVLKQPKETMEKIDFTIEGSEALKKAFVEESGLTDNYNIPWVGKYMTSRANKRQKGFDSVGAKRDKHFILPSQWEEALQYVKEYFTEDEFKIGDWVYITSTGSHVGGMLEDTGKLHNGANEGDIVLIEGITFKNGSASKTDPRYYGKNFNVRTEGLRKATPEEIKAAQTKSFKLGEHTAVVTKDKVTIADRGSVTVSKCINWFESEFVCNDTYSPLGDFTVVENTYTIDIGCVKNVPVKDIEVLYKYLKTL